MKRERVIKMKNLLSKEFKLSVHPLTYVFLAIFAFYALIPGMPPIMQMMFFGICYTFLFIGVNKGATTNDLFYTVNLPVTRSQVVKARVATTTILQMIYLVASIGLMLLGKYVITPLLPAEMVQDVTQDMGATTFLTIDHLLPLISAFLITYGLFDLIYIPWFYKTGKSVIWNMFVGMIVAGIVAGILIFIPGLIPGFLDKLVFLGPNANYIIQGIFIGIGVLFYVLSKVWTISASARNLKKLDF